MFITTIKALVYEYLCVIFFCVIFQIIMIKEEHKNGHRYSLNHFVWVYIFYIYITLVLICTGIGTIYEFTRYTKLHETISILTQFNLIPFNSISGGIMTHFTNIIMFMPLGFLLPFIWRQFKSPWKVIGTALLFSMMIELSQLLNMRSTDIDDLIMNTIGAFLGWTIYSLFKKLFKDNHEKQFHNLDKATLSFLAHYEACFYLILSFAGVFFLYNPLLF
ncbi:VanZ family protein [Clostridium kluyveri]|uniref:VanZ family protein n=1 Tax=Clostridium kluyveri TaxID=1534 RepID=UPI002246C5B9|nr:VanZ family protein [Clostridium kluyveri]UZQ51444.1 VanZ family protein [Clostridium kluyveri]